MARRLRSCFVVPVLLLATACPGGDSGPTGPTLADFVGTWAGNTSQSRAITLWVKQGLIDSLRVQASVPLGLGTCTVTYVPKSISVGNDGSFTTALASSTNITGTVSGKFNSASSASGDLTAGWNGSAICGSTFVLGTGSSITETWTASK